MDPVWAGDGMRVLLRAKLGKAQESSGSREAQGQGQGRQERREEANARGRRVTERAWELGGVMKRERI